MNRLRGAVSAAAAAAALCAGCSDSPPPETEPETEPQERTDVFVPLTNTLDRARDVEDAVLDQAEELRRRIEEAERGESPER